VPDISVYEMVGAYGTFANKGEYTEPQYLLRITDNKGTVIQDFTTKHVEVISEQVAYVMIKMLENVSDYGTAQRLRSRYGMKSEMAGKNRNYTKQYDGGLWDLRHSLPAAAGWAVMIVHPV
jgi:penicillin-binding protein 1A